VNNSHARRRVNRHMRAFSIRLPMLPLSVKEASSRSSTVVSFRASATTKPSGQLRIASVS